MKVKSIKKLKRISHYIVYLTYNVNEPVTEMPVTRHKIYQNSKLNVKCNKIRNILAENIIIEYIRIRPTKGKHTVSKTQWLQYRHQGTVPL